MELHRGSCRVGAVGIDSGKGGDAWDTVSDFFNRSFLNAENICFVPSWDYVQDWINCFQPFVFERVSVMLQNRLCWFVFNGRDCLWTVSKMGSYQTR